MSEPHVVIIGGGLAGLSSGVYARLNGFRATIVEHNIALGGVCTAWPRGPYIVDGCIHWLTGGPFDQVYEELGILPGVPIRVLEHFLTYRDAQHGFEIPVTRDLDGLFALLSELAPEDVEELRRIREGTGHIGAMKPVLDKPEELMTPKDGLAQLWNLRHDLRTVAHFRKPYAVYSAEHLRSDLLRRFFGRLLPAEAPTLFLLMVLGYLERGFLSRPVGGTARFRDALVGRYQSLGGEVRLYSTVDEILVEGGRACGVRLADGTMIPADAVISTSSAPETVLRLLGGRFGGDETRKRLEDWKLFDPIVLVTLGVQASFSFAPSTLVLDHLAPFEIGGRTHDSLHVRVFNDDPSFAPPGHTVVQTLIATNYDWWATRGHDYQNEKDAIVDGILERLEPHLPGITEGARMVDVATPLTYWNMARSWRGAYEGWIPTPDAFFTHVPKKLPELAGFYMAGQWVEPGGGIPTVVTSGRKAVQLLCADSGKEFTLKRPSGFRELGARKQTA